MKLIIGFATLTVSLMLFVGCCGADISISRRTEDSGQTDLGVTVWTSAEPVTEASAAATDESQAAATEITETEPLVTDEEFPDAPEGQLPYSLPAPIEEFSFPEEFYISMAGIVEKYALNQGCDGSDECLCRPEYEVKSEDGTVIEPRKNTVSVYFYDIDSGFEYILNPGAHYPIASTVKIPFCTLIYEKMTEGEISPDTVLTYEERHFFEGTGVIVQGDFGQQFTVQELLTLAITRSDNVAYEMLKDLVTWEEFSQFLSDNGCTHPQDIRQSKQKICCESAEAYGKILAGFLRSDSPFVPVYKEDLLNTRVKMIVSSYPVYRKYGWAGYSFHDIAYIDAPRPYILGVLTNLEGEVWADYELYREISRLIEEHSQKGILEE